MGVYRRPGSERFRNGLQYAGAVFQNVVVPKTQHAPASPSQKRISAVVFARAGMLAAIGFDDQARSNASEIDDVGRYRNLSAKPPAEALAAQVSPQDLLGIGHGST